MSKLDTILGNKFQEHKQAIVTRIFEMGGHTFKVKVPTVGENETIFDRLLNPSEEKIKLIYDDLVKDVIKYKDEPTENLKFTDNDVIVDNKSMREAAKNTIITQERIVEYFKLLIPEEGQSWDGLEYSDIESSLPFAVQIELVQKIMEVISPSYKDIRTK